MLQHPQSPQCSILPPPTAHPEMSRRAQGDTNGHRHSQKQRVDEQKYSFMETFNASTIALSKNTSYKHNPLVNTEAGAQRYTRIAKDRRQQMLAITTLILGLLFIIGPLWLLNMLSTERAKLTAISILISGFVLLLGIGTGAEPFETLAAAAAYTAVLVVFLQFGNNGD